MKQVLAGLLFAITMLLSCTCSDMLRPNCNHAAMLHWSIPAGWLVKQVSVVQFQLETRDFYVTYEPAMQKKYAAFLEEAHRGGQIWRFQATKGFVPPLGTATPTSGYVLIRDCNMISTWVIAIVVSIQEPWTTPPAPK